MNYSRRASLKKFALPLIGNVAKVLSPIAMIETAATAASLSTDYKAIVSVFLNGGYDGNDLLVRLGAGYKEYYSARPSLALSEDSLRPLKAGLSGERIGTHPCFNDLNQIYESGRLAWISNVGALVQPTSVSQVLDGSARLPPFMGSHSDQVNVVQGWDPVVSPSGWGARGIEHINPSFKSDFQAVSLSDSAMLLSSEISRYTVALRGESDFWGDIALSGSTSSQLNILLELLNSGSENKFIKEYEDTVGSALSNARKLSVIKSRMKSKTTNQFPTTEIGANLEYLVRLLPEFKAEGIRRQVFHIDFGRFDTHSLQRGDNSGHGLDIQLDQVCKALKAWDDELRVTGMDSQVVTLVYTEFGRTLAPAGSGSDHAWGNHWFVMGTPVMGGKVYGELPRTILGGVDDWDSAQRGRWVPQISSDQIAATLLKWLGVEDIKLSIALPNLNNFKSKTVGFL